MLAASGLFMDTAQNEPESLDSQRNLQTYTKNMPERKQFLLSSGHCRRLLLSILYFVEQFHDLGRFLFPVFL